MTLCYQIYFQKWIFPSKQWVSKKRQVWTNLDQFGQVWTTLDKFWPIWTSHRGMTCFQIFDFQKWIFPSKQCVSKSAAFEIWKQKSVSIKKIVIQGEPKSWGCFQHLKPVQNWSDMLLWMTILIPITSVLHLLIFTSIQKRNVYYFICLVVRWVMKLLPNT